MKDCKMSNCETLHATLISIHSQGVLICGKSGSGKSDTALKLIERYKAILVADDVVNVMLNDMKLIGYAPKNIQGLLEVRGIGIVAYPYIQQEEIKLIVHLKENIKEIERLPQKKQEVILGLAIKQIDLYAKDDSLSEKILAALRKMSESKKG